MSVLDHVSTLLQGLDEEDPCEAGSNAPCAMAATSLCSVHVRSAASGDTLLGPEDLPVDLRLDELSERVAPLAGLDAEGGRFLALRFLAAAGPLVEAKTLAEIQAESGEPLELTAVKLPREDATIGLDEVQLLSRAYPEVTSVMFSASKETASLEPAVKAFPNLQRLCVRFNGSFLYGVRADFWAPLKVISESLQELHFTNHHGARSSGQINADDVLRGLLDLSGGLKLTSFRLEGAMRLSLAMFLRFVKENQVLLPELKEFALQYWFANPPLVNDEIFLELTKRYRQLRRLEVGSCCWSLTDAAFAHFMDNADGIESGLELEDLYMVCITQVEGRDWLELESVKRHLPNLKSFRIGAGRAFCRCGEGACGSSVPRLERLEKEHGLVFNQSAAHW